LAYLLNPKHFESGSGLTGEGSEQCSTGQKDIGTQKLFLFNISYGSTKKLQTSEQRSRN
jgi:hypothetical protein